MIRLLVLLLLICPVSTWAETIAVSITSPIQSTQVLSTAGSLAVPTPMALEKDIERYGYKVIQPPQGKFESEVTSGLHFIMVAGSDFKFPMQYRLGNDPYPFATGKWPIAEMRSAAGDVIVTYSTVIEDEANSIWSFRLSPGQTESLAGITATTWIKFADGGGNYFVYDRLPTEVRPHVTP